MNDRRLAIKPETSITVRPRPWQLMPVVGAALAIGWAVSKTLRARRSRRLQRSQRIIFWRRITIIQRREW